jgi:hypothetical protein
VATHPWCPDYHVRLVRNLPGLWAFGGSMHSSTDVLGEPRRVARATFYHLHYVLKGVDSRLETAQRCERQRPGHMTEAYPANALYIPEHWTERGARARVHRRRERC